MSDTASEISALVQGLAAEIGRQRARGVRSSARLAPGKSPGPLSKPTGYAAVRQAAAACSDLGALGQAISACRACALCDDRKQPAFDARPAAGRGPLEVLMLSEVPGEAEEESGLPMAGEAGQLLARIISAGLKMDADQVYVSQLVKCRPADDRAPTPTEKQTCAAFLEREIEILRPRLILALGARAAEYLLMVERVLPGARGRVHRVLDRKIIPTFHPAFLLQNPALKNDCWQDIKVALGELG